MIAQMKKLCVLLLILGSNTSRLSADDSSLASADPYQRIVQNLSFEQAGHKIITHITLNDTSDWLFVLDINNDALLSQLQQDFSQGNEVFIMTDFHTPHYRLTTQKGYGQSYQYLVGIPKQTQDLVSTKIVQVEKFVISEGGGYFPAEYGYRVALSDGSRWEATANRSFNEVGFKSNITRWSMGDRVLVSASAYGDGYDLINIDAAYDYKLPYGNSGDFLSLDVRQVIGASLLP